MRGKVNPVGRSSIGSPVLSNVERASSTVIPGSNDLSIANAPATCGAAIDVPLFVPNWLFGIDDVIDEPVANKSKKLAILLKLEIPSTFVVEPTLITFGKQAGEPNELEEPALPEDATVAISTERRLFADWFRKKLMGSFLQSLSEV